MNPVLKLWRGAYGLAITFWVFAILIRITLHFIFDIAIDGVDALNSLAVAIGFALAEFVYFSVVTVGVIQAARSYQGFKLWAILAVLVTVCGFLVNVGIVVLLLSPL